MRFAKSLGYFALSSGVVAAGAFGYMHWRAVQNRARFATEAADESSRDNTRPQYEYFGINWGAKADMMVALLEQIDPRQHPKR